MQNNNRRKANRMTDQPSNEAKKRGRPTRKAETPLERLQRLERDLVAARRAVEEAEQRKLVAVGTAVLAEAASNPAFRNQLQQLLRARVTSKSGKADIASILDGSGLKSEPAAPAD